MPRKLKQELPKWANIYGPDPRPGDERFGTWPRETLLRMDADFTAALIVAIRSGERSERVRLSVHGHHSCSVWDGSRVQNRHRSERIQPLMR